MVGVGFWFNGRTTNGKLLFDSPPPGVGLNTVMASVPGAAMSDAGKAASIWLAVTNVVGRSAPLTC